MPAVRRILVCAVLPLLFAACSGIDITRPATDEGVVVPDAEGRVTVEVSALGWEIAEPGACGERAQCGHLAARLTADEATGENTWTGVLCGEDAIEITGTTFTVDLDSCPRKTGLFTVLVHLHDDDHVTYEGGGVADVRRFLVED